MPLQDILRLSDSAACSDLTFGKFTSFLRTQCEIRLGPACSNEEDVTRLELHPCVLGTSPEYVQGDGRRLVEMRDWRQTVTLEIERDVEQMSSGGDGFASVVWATSEQHRVDPGHGTFQSPFAKEAQHVLWIPYFVTVLSLAS